MFSKSLLNLIGSLKLLPGVGEKTAQRLALFLLTKNKDKAQIIADSITVSLNKIKSCKYCQMLTESDICNICSSPKRQKDLICIVESPVDVISIEQSHSFKGLYFILMGHLSPIDGINPEDLKIDLLLDIINQNNVQEIIIATSSTVEGEATAYYIQQITNKMDIKVTRIAHGIPMGGELEYIDIGTISRAIQHRLPM